MELQQLTHEKNRSLFCHLTWVKTNGLCLLLFHVHSVTMEALFARGWSQHSLDFEMEEGFFYDNAETYGISIFNWSCVFLSFIGPSGYILCIPRLSNLYFFFMNITELTGTLSVLQYPSPCWVSGTLMDVCLSDILISNLTYALKGTIQPITGISSLLSTNISSLLWASSWDGCHGTRTLPKQD